MTTSYITRLSDVIVPEVYGAYLTEESIKKTTVYRSGLLQTDARFNDFLAGGGDQYNMPFWKRLDGDAEAIQSGTSLATAKITTDKMISRRFFFGKGWSAEELASALAGDSAMTAIQNQIDHWWDVWMQKVLFGVIQGVIGDNQDNDSSDLVNDITTTGTVGASNKANVDAITDTYALLGDAAEFSAIAMHSTPYYTLDKLNLIDYEPTSTQNIGFGTYRGLTVIVNDQLTPDTDGANSVYWNILFKRGAIGYGESAARITPVELDRTAASGVDAIYTRRQFLMHPYGFKWTESSVNEDTPTLQEIKEAGNWDRVLDKKLCGFAILKSNG